MKSDQQRTYLYVIEIATTPQRLWAGLTSNEFWRNFSGPVQSDWKTGSSVSYFTAEGDLYAQGIVLESNPPWKLAHTWPEPAGARSSSALPPRLTWQLEAIGPRTVKLTLVHDRLSEESFRGVTAGWPILLGDLKNFLESGQKEDVPSRAALEPGAG